MERAVLRRKDLIVTPPRPLGSSAPAPFSTEYPIGKGFSSVTEFRSLQKVIPEKKWKHELRVHVKLGIAELSE